MKRSPGVEMTELKSSLAVVKSDFGALTSNRQTIRLPPTVRHVRCFSSFCRQYVHTIRPYVTVWSFGTLIWEMKSIVSVPSILGMPYARRPSSFAKLFIQMDRYLSSLMRCRNSREFPVSLLRIAPAIFLLGKFSFNNALSCHNWSAWFAAVRPWAYLRSVILMLMPGTSEGSVVALTRLVRERRL